MNYPPYYPDYRVVSPPRKRRWGIFWLVGNLLTVFCILWLWPADKPTHTVEFWFWIAAFPTLFFGIIYSARVLVYQVSVSNQRAYRQVLSNEEERWWQRHSASLSIEPLCLLGPSGDKPEHHLSLPEHEIPRPKPLPVPQGGSVLRCPQVLENDARRRETALTRHLAYTLLESYSVKYSSPPVFHALCWCGSLEARSVFSGILSEAGWTFSQPPLALNNIENLDDVIDYFHDTASEKNQQFLCAGVFSAKEGCPDRIVGEAGFVWLTGMENSVNVHRVERQDTPEETPQILTQRVEKCAHPGTSPEYCFSFDHRAADEMQSGGWSTLDHEQHLLWGDLQQIIPFVAISLAAFQCVMTRKPCGWVGRDKENKNILGVVTIDEK